MQIEDYLSNKDGEIRKVEDTVIGSLKDKNVLEQLTKEMKEFPDEEVYFSCDRSTFGLSIVETTELYRAIYGLPQPFYPDLSPEGKVANTSIGIKLKKALKGNFGKYKEKKLNSIVHSVFLYYPRDKINPLRFPEGFECTEEEKKEFYDLVNSSNSGILEGGIEEYIQNKDGELMEIEDTVIANFSNKTPLKKLTEEMKLYPEWDEFLEKCDNRHGFSDLQLQELHRAIYEVPQPFKPDLSPGGKIANTAFAKKFQAVLPSNFGWEQARKLKDFVESYLYSSEEDLPDYEGLYGLGFTEEEKKEFYDAVNAH